MTIIEKLFRPLRTKKQRERAEEEIRSCAVLDATKYIIISFAGIIIILGLILDSVAIVIGGMLIAPLMHPFLGLSLGAVKGDYKLFRKTFISLVLALIFVVLFSFLISLILPFDVPGEQITARTQVNLIHLIVALAAGTIGALSIYWPKSGAGLAGVLVAAALLPPLCVIGYNLAGFDWVSSWNAFLLFLSNSIAIIFMGIIVFLLVGFKPPHLEKREKFFTENIIWSTLLLLIIAVPMTWALIKTIDNEKIERTLTNIISRDLSARTEISKVNFHQDGKKIISEVTVYTDKEITNEEMQKITNDASVTLEKTVELTIFEIIFNRR